VQAEEFGDPPRAGSRRRHHLDPRVAEHADRQSSGAHAETDLRAGRGRRRLLKTELSLLE